MTRKKDQRAVTQDSDPLLLTLTVEAECFQVNCYRQRPLKAGNDPLFTASKKNSSLGSRISGNYILPTS